MNDCPFSTSFTTSISSLERVGLDLAATNQLATLIFACGLVPPVTGTGLDVDEEKHGFTKRLAQVYYFVLNPSHDITQLLGFFNHVDHGMPWRVAALLALELTQRPLEERSCFAQ